MPEHRLATQIHKGRYIQTADPGAVGAGVEWLDTNTTPAIHKKRNAGDSGWDTVLDPSTYVLGSTITAAGAALIDDANAAAQRTTLGLGTSATKDIDTDGTLAANSSTRVPAQSAIVTYVAAAIAALINSAPGALDTLKELADAIGDDANFAATVSTALALKAALAGATFTGPVAVPEDAYDATTWNGSTNVPTKNAVRDKIEALIAGLASYSADESTLHLAGSTFSVKAGGIGPTELASTAVTPASYGDASNVPQFTVDADGRVTAAANVAITAGAAADDASAILAGQTFGG